MKHSMLDAKPHAGGSADGSVRQGWKHPRGSEDDGGEVERRLLYRIEQEVRAYYASDVSRTSFDHLCSIWEHRVTRETQRLINPDQTVNTELLRNFRRHQIFVDDVPTWDPERLSLRSLLGGGRRGDRRKLRECLGVVRTYGYEDLLRKYPCSPVGRPYMFTCDGFAYTYRWFRHIYLLGLLKKVLGSQLGNSPVGLDIGSSYGIFSSLVKREFPNSHHVLVDFPGQLILAYYFLGMTFPDARIAGVKEFSGGPALSRSMLMQYDFVLLPCEWYQRLELGAVDLITNFASLGEMKREWFDFYLKAPVFTSAQYFYTMNRIQSAPIYDTNITILDYPIWDRTKALHFAICPVFGKVFPYHRRFIFSYARGITDPHFEYIGHI